MIVLHAQKIDKSFGSSPVLTSAELVLEGGHCVGIVGPNGGGKSTLAKIICGLLPADSGQVVLQRGLSLGYLAQSSADVVEGTVYSCCEAVFAPLFAQEKKLRALEQEMGAYPYDSADYRRVASAYDALTAAYEQAGGYAWKSRLSGALLGLGFSKQQFDQDTATLSGGQQARLALARLLLSNPDILVLDEPTNHLDIDCVQWLEDYLRAYAGSIILVSHDRYFLDALCDDICALDHHKTHHYSGNYSEYLLRRETDEALYEKHYELQQRAIRREEAVIEKLRQFNREKSIKRARSREKMLSRVECMARPVRSKAFSFHFDTGQSSGQDVFLAEDLSKSYGSNTLFSRLNLHVRAGDRIAVIGPNGCGKSTLLQLLRGHLLPDSGFVRRGVGVNIGYFDQQQAELLNQNTVLGELHDAYPQMMEGELRSALAAFLFRGDDVFQDIGTLSGGEKARLALLKIMLHGDNTLLLDEPTNHLDMDARNALEDALDDFDGTILAVSHDRYFINRFATRVLAFTEEGPILDLLGNWDDYLDYTHSAGIPAEESGGGGTRTAQKKQQRATREGQKQRRSLALAVRQTEEDVFSLETQLAEAGAQLADVASLSPEELQALSSHYASLEKSLALAMQSWEEATLALETFDAE